MTATTSTTPATSRDRQRRRVAIRAARLFDGLGDTTVPDPLVVVADGRIVSVEFGPRAAAPPDAETVDLPGATLMPGLVDAHVHLAFDAGPDAVGALAARDDDAVLDAMAAAAAIQLAAGVTTVRDLGDRDYLALRLRERPGPLPTIAAAGPPITSAGGHCHFLGGATVQGVDGVRVAVREHAARGVDVIKVMASGGNLTPGSDALTEQLGPDKLAALVAEAHRHGLPVTAHAHGLPSIEAAVAARVDGLEHCSFMTADGVRATDELVATIVARRIAVSGTLGVVPCPDMPGPPPSMLRHLPAMISAHARLVARGALYVVGTDAGIGPVKPHGVLPHGLADLVRLGMTPAAALRTGTSTAAQVCGFGDR
ncbi:amidohydrolase family protein [Pseudonocardia sp. TRM90224]|uniref:amidohydrolase family protein n=1 Tax=Pseudonocardia sp. TRM90224 TaxID=2812678 RepID=UPI001E2DD006|nr:amidohydrolase family protein [Pseudonocardia sp. TRM90224]